MGEYMEAHKEMLKQMKRYNSLGELIKPSRDELNSVYLGAISLYLASIADSLDEIVRKEKTNRQKEDSI